MVCGSKIEASVARPTIVLFKSLASLLWTHPTPLRESLLDELYKLLAATLPKEPETIKLRAKRVFFREDGEDGVEFVERLQKTNEELLTQARSQGGMCLVHMPKQ
jgi:hypothetical protein